MMTMTNISPGLGLQYDKLRFHTVDRSTDLSIHFHFNQAVRILGIVNVGAKLISRLEGMFRAHK